MNKNILPDFDMRLEQAKKQATHSSALPLVNNASQQSDDSAKRIADFLTSQGVRSTFRVVGEKARTLEHPRREDVVAALGMQEIANHSNYHSWPVTPARFEKPINGQKGAEKLIRREQPGLWDWPIFRHEFDGKHSLGLARLQARILKHAQLETARRVKIGTSLWFKRNESLLPAVRAGDWK